jgi:primosomal protein N'
MANDTRPVPVDELAEISHQHRRWGGTAARCTRCGEDWPCITRRLSDQVSALTANGKKCNACRHNDTVHGTCSACGSDELAKADARAAQAEVEREEIRATLRFEGKIAQDHKRRADTAEQRLTERDKVIRDLLATIRDLTEAGAR